MTASLHRSKYHTLTEEIIRIYYTVYNKLGYGFLEKVYENAMMIEFAKAGIAACAQSPIDVKYDGELVGEYSADILVEDSVILELKAAKSLLPDNEAQLLNYLRATDKEFGLLLNFGPKPEIKRKLFDNDRKIPKTWNKDEHESWDADEQGRTQDYGTRINTDEHG